MTALMTTTTGLDSWLQVATRRLAKNSATQVRSEIQEHYESAREAAMNNGATVDEADRLAVAALGDPKTANCQYRNVLLTSAEARLLGQGNWEARAICSRPWLKWFLLATPVAALIAAGELFLRGAHTTAWTLLVGALGLAFLFAAPFLPIYTPSRGRVYRVAKWVVLPAMLGLAFWPDTLKWSWLLITCLWMIARIEVTRVSIRRKLPVAQWPKQLYL
jgi:hypothetical protein